MYCSTLPLHWEGLQVQVTVLYKMTCLYTDSAFHLSSEVWISCFLHSIIMHSWYFYWLYIYIYYDLFNLSLVLFCTNNTLCPFCVCKCRMTYNKCNNVWHTCIKLIKFLLQWVHALTILLRVSKFIRNFFSLSTEWRWPDSRKLRDFPMACAKDDPHP